MSVLTPEGLLLLKREEERLLAEEKRAVEAMTIARGFGDFSENAELDSAREWLTRTQQKMVEINEKIRNSEVISLSSIKLNEVGFGADVELEFEENGSQKSVKYRIVGEDEADIAQGKISYKSPIAFALRGKKIGDECEVFAPSGERTFLIKSINYDWLK